MAIEPRSTVLGILEWKQQIRHSVGSFGPETRNRGEDELSAVGPVTKVRGEDDPSHEGPKTAVRGEDDVTSRVHDPRTFVRGEDISQFDPQFERQSEG